MPLDPDFSSPFRTELENLFRWRRDVRHFDRRPLAPGLLEELLSLADIAPSVGLSQPWRFVTIDDVERRARVRHEFEACNRLALTSRSGARATDYARLKLAGLGDAPCHLAVFVEPEPSKGGGLGRRTMPETVAYSAVMSIHTLWLAARAAGVGLGWVSILEPDRINWILDVPSGWRLVGYLCLGYPAAEDDVPELEREGWERRAATERLRR